MSDLGHKLASLGRSWRQVGSFLARCCEKVGRRWAKMANLSGKSEREVVGTVGCRSTGNGRKTPLEPVGRVGKLELAGLDTRFKHARLTAPRGRRISKTPAASTAGPFFSAWPFRSAPLGVHGERSNLKAKIIEESCQKAWKIEPES